MTKTKPKFLRKDFHKMSKLGKRRKKKQVWRKPTGRDNKMREKRKGHRKVVSIGYKSEDRKKFVIVNNIKDLEKAKGKEIVIGNVGTKKKLEIAKVAKEKKIKIYNMNAEKYLKMNTLKKKEKVVEKKDDKKQGTKSPTSSAEASSNERKKENEEEKK